MNQDSRADKIAHVVNDTNVLYAHCWLERSPCDSHGHMLTEISMAGMYYKRPKGVIRINSQIGSTFGDSSMNKGLYAARVQFIPNGLNNGCDLDDMEVAIKVMRKIDKALRKLEDANKWHSFAEYCQAVLVGAGVKHLITECDKGWIRGANGDLANKDIYTVGEDSLARLTEMEKTLVQYFSEKVA